MRPWEPGPVRGYTVIRCFGHGPSSCSVVLCHCENFKSDRLRSSAGTFGGRTIELKVSTVILSREVKLRLNSLGYCIISLHFDTRAN